jgi:hypothetical protein
MHAFHKDGTVLYPQEIQRMYCLIPVSLRKGWYGGRHSLLLDDEFCEKRLWLVFLLLFLNETH